MTRKHNIKNRIDNAKQKLKTAGVMTLAFIAGILLYTFGGDLSFDNEQTEGVIFTFHCAYCNGHHSLKLFQDETVEDVCPNHFGDHFECAWCDGQHNTEDIEEDSTMEDICEEFPHTMADSETDGVVEGGVGRLAAPQGDDDE